MTTTGGGVIGYQYDANGNHTRLTWNDGYFVTYAYDALNRMTDVKQSGTSSLAHYSYDTLSRRTGITYGDNSTAAYAYNVNDDMASVTHGFTGGPVPLSYTYNKVHQITNMTVSDNNYLPPRRHFRERRTCDEGSYQPNRHDAHHENVLRVLPGIVSRMWDHRCGFARVSECGLTEL